MRPQVIVIIPAALLALFGCEKPSGLAPQDTRPTAAQPTTKVIVDNRVLVAVFTDGRLQVDGQPASLAQLDARFADAHKEGASVWYYRENSSDEPHENAMKVMDLLAKHRLPITFSASRDFSTYVDMNTGISYPRSRLSEP